MALIKDASSSWSTPVILQTDEVWQVRRGSVYITTSEQPEADDGLAIVLRDGIRLKAGSQVRYRKEGNTVALIAREAL